MSISELLTPQAVLPDMKAGGLKQALSRLAVAAKNLYGVNEAALNQALQEREARGATAMGGGVAIPHARIEELTQPRGIFARLTAPVDWEAPDGVPVDLAFLLITPLGENGRHLKALASVSRLMRSPGLCEKLRATTHPEALYMLLMEGEGGRETKSQAS